jgi:hypothetical protein
MKSPPRRSDVQPQPADFLAPGEPAAAAPTPARETVGQTGASQGTDSITRKPEVLDHESSTEEKVSLNSRTPPLCPSAQPDMPNSLLFGVVVGTPEQRRVGYLTRPKPVNNEVLALAGPVKPTEVFRLAATCVGHSCRHFDGADCTLAKRIVQFLPAAVSGLPPCKIRASCRWWQQEGRSACLRCPLVITDGSDESAEAETEATPRHAAGDVPG